MSLKTLLKRILVALVIIIVLGYTLYQTRNVIAGPQLTILSPANGSTHTDSFTIIKGATQNVSKVSINDRPIFIDTDGNFADAIALLSGYNIITVKAEGRFGKEITEVLELVLKEDVTIQDITKEITEEEINTPQVEEGVEEKVNIEEIIN